MEQTERTAWLMEHSHHGVDLDAVMQLLGENERLRNALKIIANPKNWQTWRNPETGEISSWVWRWATDPAQIARDVLEGE